MIRYGVRGAILLLMVAVVLAVFRESDPTSQPLPVASGRPSAQQGDLEERLAWLEAALQDEREQRLALEQRVSQLVEQTPSSGGRFSSSNTSQAPTGETVVTNQPPGGPRQQVNQRRNDSQSQVDRLVAGGFDEYQASEIVRMTEEIQMQLLNARYEANQSGEPADMAEQMFAATQQMRQTLGEADYEKYLEATRQPTTVAVRTVLESSPAKLAGIESGDQIISYDGERVYNMAELNRLTNQSDPSSRVVVEVIRDGQPISFSVPAGPMGVASGPQRGGFLP